MKNFFRKVQMPHWNVAIIISKYNRRFHIGDESVEVCHQILFAVDNLKQLCPTAIGLFRFYATSHAFFHVADGVTKKESVFNQVLSFFVMPIIVNYLVG